MINLELEKSLALDAQERYDIISFAMDAADDNGFINSFVFERALYCFAAIMLYPDQKEVITESLTVSPVETWNKLAKEGFIEKMIEDYEPTLTQLAEEAKTWFDEYSAWAHSVRGLIDLMQRFTGNFVEDAANTLRRSVKETGVEEVLDIAEE